VPALYAAPALRGFLYHLLIAHITVFSFDNLLAVCCASRMKSQRSDRRALFYPANRIEPEVHSTPDNRDFALLTAQKSTSATGSLFYQYLV
jgi:hypothetical protein